MTNAENLQEVLQYMQEEFYSQGEVEITYGAIGGISMLDQSIEMMACSFIRTSWDEAIHYDPQGEVFFFYGELRTAFGGEKTYFVIGENMLPLLPVLLKEALQRVAKTQISETISFTALQFLLD